MKRFWRWLTSTSDADRLRRIAKREYERVQLAKWEQRREFYESAIEANAAAGEGSFAVGPDDARLFAEWAPGYRWARAKGLEIQDARNLFGQWIPVIRWDR